MSMGMMNMSTSYGFALAILLFVRREWDVFCVVDVIVADLALLCFGEIDALITLLQIWQRASPAGARQTRHETVLASV